VGCGGEYGDHEPDCRSLSSSTGSANFVRLFKPQFVPMVEAGTKCQTVRPWPKRVPHVGDSLSLRTWTGKPYRSKQRVLREAVVSNVRHIYITDTGWVWLDDMRIKLRSEFESFARADGFENPEQMLAWFRLTHGLPFDGIVIYWQNADFRDAP
jgi:hypothetical protein